MSRSRSHGTNGPIRRAALFGTLVLAGSGAFASDELSDPTRPPIALATPKPTPASDVKALDLRAIFISEGRRIALINDQRVREQDRIGDARVIRIDYDGVRLSRNGKAFELELIGRSVKRDEHSRPAAPDLDGRREEGKRP